MRFTKSFNVRPAGICLGQRAANATSQPKLYRLHLPRGKPGMPWSPLTTISVLSNSPNSSRRFQKPPKPGIYSETFTQVVADILAHIVHVPAEKRAAAPSDRPGLIPRVLYQIRAAICDVCLWGPTSSRTVYPVDVPPERRRSFGAIRRRESVSHPQHRVRERFRWRRTKIRRTSFLPGA